MKIALAHDSFTQMGGAERVVDVLHELFPDAPVFTLVFDPKFKERYNGWDIRTSRLQTLYLIMGRLQYLLPLIPWGVDSLDFSGYDLVISSSSGFIKNIRVAKNCIHINYCHTPTRFLWNEPEYLKQEVGWFQRPFVSAILKRMKIWDYNGAQRVTEFIANSKEVEGRIKKFYNRDGKVIYPFVDTGFWTPSETCSKQLQGTSGYRNYFLLGGRLHAHKKADLIVQIFNELGIPLHVVGDGRHLEYLKSIAKSNIIFPGRVSDEHLREQYRGAKALLFPQVEDFGLMPLEAAACGTPTLAYARGGALETIVPGVTGEFFDSYDKEQIKRVLLHWNSGNYSVENLRLQAEKFGKAIFKEKIVDHVKSITKEYK